MTTQHTSGEWYVERIPRMMDKRPDEKDIWAVYSTRKTRFFDKPQPICNFDWGTPEGKANAHLIAAAPKLLQVLKDLLPEFVELYERFDPTGEIAVWDQWTQEALEVIAEAEGRTK